VAAADEVPPHDDFLGERRAAEQQDARLLAAQVGQLHRGRAGRQVAELRPFEAGARQADRPGVHEHAVLVRGLRRQREPGVRVEHDLGAEQRRVRRHRRLAARESAKEHAHRRTA
jgi:hypothetical protein